MLLLQSCLTLSNPPGSSVLGIFQARILEWVAISSSGDLPNPGIKPASPESPALGGGFFTNCATRAAPKPGGWAVTTAPLPSPVLAKTIRAHSYVNSTCQSLSLWDTMSNPGRGLWVNTWGFHQTNPPTNLRTHQPSHQPTHPVIDQPTHQLTHPAINQPSHQPSQPSSNPLTNQQTKPPTNLSTNQPVVVASCMNKIRVAD